jgi:hypothetical protein
MRADGHDETKRRASVNFTWNVAGPIYFPFLCHNNPIRTAASGLLRFLSDTQSVGLL